MDITAKEISAFLATSGIEFEYRGGVCVINGFSSLNNYRPKTITWCKDVENCKRSVDIEQIELIVIGNNLKENCSFINCIMCDDPKKVFFSIGDHFFSTDIQVPEIGSGTYISKNVIIGKNVKIGVNCVIDGDIRIGENSIIANSVNIVNKVKIGKNCIIQSGVVLGHDDFSYYEDKEHNKTMIKHYGGIDIGDDVFIGANCVVNRGTIDDTQIGDGTKIDSQCHISHNCIIGEKNSIISGSRIYGSVRTGNNVYIATSIIRNQMVIGDNAIVAMGSVVIRPVEHGSTVAGVPAKELNCKIKEI